MAADSFLLRDQEGGRKGRGLLGISGLTQCAAEVISAYVSGY